MPQEENATTAGQLIAELDTRRAGRTPGAARFPDGPEDQGRSGAQDNALLDLARRGELTARGAVDQRHRRPAHLDRPSGGRPRRPPAPVRPDYGGQRWRSRRLGPADRTHRRGNRARVRPGGRRHPRQGGRPDPGHGPRTRRTGRPAAPVAVRTGDRRPAPRPPVHAGAAPALVRGQHPRARRAGRDDLLVRAAGAPDVFKSWITHRQQPADVLRVERFDHLVLTADADATRRKLHGLRLSPHLRLAGSYLYDIDSQESAVRSALQAVEEIDASGSRTARMRAAVRREAAS